jgi:hypothetical protein
MAKNGLTIAEVTAFAERVKAALAHADTDRRTVDALRALVRGEDGGGKRGAGTNGTARTGRANDGRILSFVKSHKGGARVGDMIKTLGMNRKALARALQRLRAGGSI